MELKIIKNKVISALRKFYDGPDNFLIKYDLCERCINHRFAIHLEKEKFKGYYIDCEYNKAFLNGKVITKDVSNINGNYIDIIITKRDKNPNNDLACIEIKKQKNYQGRDKDRDNLRILTGGQRYSHKYGFYIIFGKVKNKTLIEIYKGGQLIETLNL